MATSEDKRNRNLKLCQLIKERKIDNDVGAEIRKLLIEGVDINTQDLNRNKNTPLHLAAQNADKICLRLLLKYKPNLKIRNSEGKTPIDVARNAEVKELLSSASFDVVEKKFVREIDFQNLSLERLKCLENDPAFKVLKITSCPNAHIVWEKLNGEDYRAAVTKSSHLFVIAIETQEDEIKKLLKPSVDIKRPIIVQITSDVSKKSLIYYKDRNSKQLIEIKFHSTIGKDGFLQEIQLRALCNFSSFAQALNSNVFGAFSGSLLNVKLNNEENRNEIVNCFAKSNALCHRFFKLFDEKLTEEELNARAVSALLLNGDQSFSALLDLPFEFENEIKLSDDQKRILSFVDSRNYNLVMIAIECNNRDAVKTLLRFPIDLDHLASDNRWASDICWINQCWEILAELIAAGSPYPDNFDASLPSFKTSISFNKMKSTMKASTAFHESIQRGDIEAVKLFIINNPKHKRVYDRSNKSALTVALECGQTNIYSLLLSERFTPGVDDEYDEAFKNCKCMDEIRDKNREYFRNAFDEPHLKRLLNKYKVSFSSTNREACSQVIQKMFLKLNEIPEMVPILRIVSCSERLKIVFDFDCNSVQEMDPTEGSSTKGIVYPISGFIYIGAKNHREDFFKVIGTVAHELTHFAMKLTYENSCKPYAINDKANQELFESIVNETRIFVISSFVQEASSIDSIIRVAFTCYKQDFWHQELIVRVPHLLVNYKNAAETLEETRPKLYRLFDFFISKVLPDVELKTKVLMHKLDVEKINSLTGTIEKIEAHEFRFKELSDIKLEDQIFGSNAPQLTLGMLHQSLGESSHIFINIEQISFGNISERIGKLEKKDFAIVVDCAGMVQKYEETIWDVRKKFHNSGKIFLVMAAEETSIATSKLTNFRVTHAQHSWGDLSDDSQEVLLQKNVNFQGTICCLKDLTNKQSVALLELPLKEFCNSVNFKIGDPLADPCHKFYLPRNFITRIPKKHNKGDQLENDTDTSANDTDSGHSNLRPQIEKRLSMAKLKTIEEIIKPEKFETVDKSLSQILAESEEKTIVIISDSAGTGKTSTLHEIARKLRENDITRWTILTDLKQHIKMLKKIRKEEIFKSFQDFVTKIVLAEKSVFEQELLSQFYEEGRTNILLDGFDEISPLYKKEILKALKLFAPKSGNQLWVTTRSHLELELEKALDQLSCSLQPLTRDFQIEFLEKVWQSDTKSNAITPSISAKDLIDALSSICDSNSSFIGSPILISMVAEIFSEKYTQIKTLTFYRIFKEFVNKNIDISVEKGEIAVTEGREILKQSEGIVGVHRKIAIAHFFGNEIEYVDVDYDDEEYTVEKLTRFGLIRYDELRKSLSFIHETFAEYFLTDFIVGNLRTKARALGAVTILVRVLNEKDFQVVRLFLDQALKELKFIGKPLNAKDDKKLCETVGKRLNVMKDQSSGVLLHITDETCEEIFKFMWQTIKHVEEPIRLIIGRNEDGCNVLLLSIARNRKTMIQALFDFIEQNTKLDNAKIIVQAINDNKLNVFHFAMINKNEEIVPTLYGYMQKILTPDEIKTMLRAKNKLELNLLHLNEICNRSAFNDLIKIYKAIFSNGEMKEMFFECNKYGNNRLHDAVRLNNKNALNYFFKLLNENLNCEEFKKLIHQRGVEHGTIFNSACGNKNEEIFPTIYENIHNVLTREEIKRMLRAKNRSNTGSSVLQLAAAMCNVKALNDLIKLLKKLLSNEEIKEMLSEVNLNGDNSLHVAVHHNNKIAINCFFKQLNETLKFDETKKLIQQRGFGKGNIFHSAFVNENEEIFPTIHECTKKFLKKHEMKKMLSEKDKIGFSLLDYAAKYSKENALNDLMKILQKYFSNGEIKEMLFEVNKFGRNTLHDFVNQNNKTTLNCLFKHLNEILNYEETKKLIDARGLDRRNIFQSACENKNQEIFSTIHDYTIKFFEEHEIKKMLSEKHIMFGSVLQFATELCNENELNDLVKILKRYFSNEEMKKMKNIYLTILYKVLTMLLMVWKWFSQFLSWIEARMMQQNLIRGRNLN